MVDGFFKQLWGKICLMHRRLAYVGKRAHMSVGAMAYLGAIILPVALGQHRGCGSEYQLEKIAPRYANIEKPVLR